MAMYPIKLSFIIQILLIFTYEVQTSMADESHDQRNLLRESFQKVLMNNSENLLTLQQIFLTPRQKNPNGLCLDVDVTVEGRVTDDYRSLDWIYDCNMYFPQNNSCVYHTSRTFEVLPATNQDSTVKIFLNTDKIRLVLQVLDPSFYILAATFRLTSDYFDYTTDCQLTFEFYIHTCGKR